MAKQPGGPIGVPGGSTPDPFDEDRLARVLGRPLPRRDFLRLTGFAGTSAGLAAFLAACGSGGSSAAPSSGGAAKSGDHGSPSTRPWPRPAARSRSAMSRPRPDRWRPSGRPTTTPSAPSTRRWPVGSSSAGPAPGPDHHQGQPVGPEPRRGGGRLPDRRRQGRLDAWSTRLLRRRIRSPTSPRRTASRASRRLPRGSRTCSGVRKTRPRLRSRAVRLDVPLLLGSRGRHARLPRHVEPGHNEQARRRSLPE